MEEKIREIMEIAEGMEKMAQRLKQQLLQLKGGQMGQRYPYSGGGWANYREGGGYSGGGSNGGQMGQRGGHDWGNDYQPPTFDPRYM